MNLSQLRRLSELSASLPDLAPYLTRELALRARAFMIGVALYRDHPAQRGEETAPVIWREGTTSLRDFAPETDKGVPVLLVPSLVNRFSILDLQPEHSFVKFLASAGFKPFVIDWDTPQEDEKAFSMEDYVAKRLLPALAIASAKGKAHVIGYCMGGNLALAMAALEPSRVRSLSLLATPWDFESGCTASGVEGAALEKNLRAWAAGNDFLPVEAVQSVFTSFQPLHAFHKFSAFAGYDQSSMEATRFVLTEDWLNDGVPLTLPTAKECFGDWFARNVTMRNEWRICDKIIDPAAIQVPSYVVVPAKDQIVPPQSSWSLAKTLQRATCLEPDMGHIGIMSSPKAVHQVWKPLTSWMLAH